MKQTLKTIHSILLKNWTVIVTFQILYGIICYSILYSILHKILGWGLKAAGISYISFENFSLLFLNPVSALLLLVLFAVYSGFLFVEVAALYHYCEMGWENTKITLGSFVRSIWNRFLNFFRMRNIIFLLGFSATTLLSILPFSQHILQWIKIPEFMLHAILKNIALWGVFLVVILTFNILFVIYLFAWPCFLFLGENSKASWLHALQLLKGRWVKIIGKLFFLFMVFLMETVCILLLGIACLVGYDKIFYSGLEGAHVFGFIAEKWSNPFLLLFAVASNVWLVASSLTIFHEMRKELRPKAAPQKTGFLMHARRGIAVIVVISMLFIYSETEAGGALTYGNMQDTQVIAHRAGAVFAPENTISALNIAIADGANTAEIDVQQLGDGTLIVLHDSNFKRTTGQNKAVWEVNHAQVKQYDAGVWFNNRFAGESIPTLEEMLIFAKDKIKLMVELKFTGHEQNLEESVLRLIRQYNMVQQCSVASMNLKILQRVKAAEPEIETVYITPLLFSEQYDIPYIDSYSVETTSISREMTTMIHHQGKKIYGWTANSKKSIMKNLYCEVDGIVTDNTPLGRYCIVKKEESIWVVSWINEISDSEKASLS